MHLTEALQADGAKVVSIIGGGGKTSLMFRLAGELAAIGRYVITTTTTKILSPSTGESSALFLIADPRAEKEHIRQAGIEHRHLTLAAGLVDDAGKLRGFQPEIIDALSSWDFVDHVIVEADGAGRKPLKACASHEPVIALSSDLLVAVAGLDALSCPAEECVFRHEIFAKVTGTGPGDPVTPTAVAQILAHDLGRISETHLFRTIIFLNKADDTEAEAQGEAVCEALHSRQDVIFQRTVVASLADMNSPVKKMRDFLPPQNKAVVAGIILAAGKSLRMGTVKGLLPFGTSCILQNVIHTAELSMLDLVVLVVGHDADNITAQLQFGRTEVVCNENYSLGQSSSLQAGLAAVEKRCDYAMFLLGDQPLVKSETINLLIESAGSGAAIVAPTCNGRRGNPVLIHRMFFSEIKKIKGDAGARSLLSRFAHRVKKVAVDDSGVLLDIDTREEYAQLIQDHHVYKP